MNDDNQFPIEIPFEQLSAEALRGVAEAFVLREGTEYGEHEFTLEQKLEHIVEQLRRGEATILFDKDSSAVEIVMKRDIRAQRPKSDNIDKPEKIDKSESSQWKPSFVKSKDKLPTSR